MTLKTGQEGAAPGQGAPQPPSMPVALVLSFRQSQPGPRSPDPRGLGGTCQEGSDLPRLDSLQVSRVYTSPRAEGRRGDRHQAPSPPPVPRALQPLTAPVLPQE